MVETLPQTIDLEEGLRNGVFLGKLAHFMTPDLVPIKKIYDRDQTRFKVSFLFQKRQRWKQLNVYFLYILPGTNFHIHFVYPAEILDKVHP